MGDAAAGGVGFEPTYLVMAATLLLLVSGIPGLLVRRAGIGQVVATGCMLVAALLGIPAALSLLLHPSANSYRLPWLSAFGPLTIAVDPLSAWFLLPIFLIGGAGSLYALRYWPAAKHPDTEPWLTFCYGLLAASMAGLTISRDAIMFLVCWECMALSAFCLVITEHDRAEAREAGMVYFIATHTATLCLFATFGLLRAAGDSFAFPLAGSLDAGQPLAAAIFLTALCACGAKAGLMPLHIWLPSAHATVPSHVSAFMSGVILKMGVYGLFRVLSWFGPPPSWWGMLLLALGVFSAVAGVAFALGQHDLKRLLAYHSIENIGIIVMGLGVALLGVSLGNPAIALLGGAGALLHVLNHATFKALLFLGAGSVIHRSGTRELDRLGGLARQLPATFLCFLVGSVAICGLPPLNGFVSELLVYLGLFRQAMGVPSAAAALAAVAIPALALVGGLAVACFVKVNGVVFQGHPRQVLPAGTPGEGGWPMLVPQYLLAVLCLLIGLFPGLWAPLLQSAVGAWLPMTASSRLVQEVPFWWLTLAGIVLLALVGSAALLLRRAIQRHGSASEETWGCGYLAPTVRMQYTASSFAATLVDLFRPLLRPHGHRPQLQGAFPRPERFDSHVPEVVLDLWCVPALRWLQERLRVARRLQHGQMHLYILYIVLTLILLLAWH